MQRNNFLATLAVAALLSVPIASAGWSVHGSYEPDTLRDQSDGFMTLDPDVNPSEAAAAVYFNAIQHTFTTALNPNVAALKSGIRSTPHQTFAAYLGVWKDCNKDGYIGMTEGALIEYPSALLMDQSVCPAGGLYNHDGWVHEFRWIAPGDINVGNGNASADAQNNPPRFINDTQSLVWGDRGLPGARSTGSCPVNPLPAGTTSSTGGFIDYIDCIQPFVYQWDALVTPLDPSLALGDEPQSSRSPLNQQFPIHPYYDPYGEDGTQTGALEDTNANNREKDYAFRAFDCSQEGTVIKDETGELPQNVRIPLLGSVNLTDEEGTIYVVPAPSTDPRLNPRGSFFDSINETEEATTEACEGDDDNAATAGWTLTGYAPGIGLVEDYYGGVDADAGRRKTDIYFSFQHTAYGVLLLDPFVKSLDDDQNACIVQDDEDVGDVPPGCKDTYIIKDADGTISDDTPGYAGVGLLRTDAFFGGPIWYGLPNAITPPQTVRRDNLQPEGPTTWTFYAHVGPATSGFAKTPSFGLYGSEACGTGPSDKVLNGWDCNPNHWWNPQFDPGVSAMPTQGVNSDESCTNANGATSPNCRDVGARVFQAYQLRDIDCYDGQVARGVPVHASLVQLSPESVCARATA